MNEVLRCTCWLFYYPVGILFCPVLVAVAVAVVVSLSALKHSIGKHRLNEHRKEPSNLYEQFTILKKRREKFEYLAVAH